MGERVREITVEGLVAGTRDVVADVARADAVYIVLADGRPVAAIVGYESFQNWQAHTADCPASLERGGQTPDRQNETDAHPVPASIDQDGAISPEAAWDRLERAQADIHARNAHVALPEIEAEIAAARAEVWAERHAARAVE